MKTIGYSNRRGVTIDGIVTNYNPQPVLKAVKVEKERGK